MKADGYCVSLMETSLADGLGGKGAGLATVAELGIRVPETVLVRRAALSDFLEESGIRVGVRQYLSEFPSLSSQAQSTRYEAIRREVTETPMPGGLDSAIRATVEHLLTVSPCGLAVRSAAVCEDSVEASFAGVFESELGMIDFESVIGALRSCWCSLWAPRALRYMLRMEIEPSTDGMDVILQPVISAQFAGVIYTASPETGNPWVFQARVVRGLSSDLMSGSGKGDLYLVDWKSGAVISSEIEGQEAILRATSGGVRQETLQDGGEPMSEFSGASIARVAEIARTIDEAFGRRVDVEWAIDEEGVAIVQARPMTAIPEFFPVELDRENAQVTWVPALFPGIPDATAQYVVPFDRDLSGRELWHRYQPKDITLVGFPGGREMDFHGYRFVCSTPMKNFLDDLAPSETESWLDRNLSLYSERWSRVRNEIDGIVGVASGAISLNEVAELIPVMLRVRDLTHDLNSFGWSGPQALGWMCEGLLAEFCKANISDGFRTDLLLGGGADSYYAEIARRAQELARSIDEEVVLAALREHAAADIVVLLQEKAPRCRFLADLDSLCWAIGRPPPSWRVRPEPWGGKESGRKGHPAFAGRSTRNSELLSSIKRTLLDQARDAVEIQRAAKSRSVQNERDALAVLEGRGKDIVDRFHKILDQARVWTQALNDRHRIAVAFNWMMELFWHTADRMVQSGLLGTPEELFCLYRDDLENEALLKDPERFRSLGRKRSDDFAGELRLVPPSWLGKKPAVPEKGEEAEAEAEQTLEARDAGDDEAAVRGQGFSVGEAEGPVRCVSGIEDPAFLDSLTGEEVLVLTTAYASHHADWHSLIISVRGVVSVGRPSHHLQQVARECDVPLVGEVSSDFVGRVQDGMRLKVDGITGEVRVV